MKRNNKLMIVLMIVVMVLTTVLVGCGAPQEEGGAQTEEVINWSFYSALGPNDAACCELWPQLFEQIEEETNGRLVITTYWSGQHPYEGEDLLKVVKDGQAELGYFIGSYASAAEPVFGADGIPMLFPNDLEKHWAAQSALWGNFEGNREGVLEDILQERWNASMVHMMPGGQTDIFTVGYDVDGLDSLKGHKVRTYSSDFASFVQVLGGTPVPISFSEVYTALATNLIDGVITAASNADSAGFFEYADTVNRWTINISCDAMIVSLDALNSLPDDVREVFVRVMHESATKPEMLDVERDQATREKVESEGVKIFTPSAESQQAVLEKVEEAIWEPWIETVGDDAIRVLEQIEPLR